MKTNIHFWSYLAHFFLEWKMLQTKVVEKIKIQILRSTTFFPKWCRLWDNVGKYGRAGQDIVDNKIQPTRLACWIPKATKNTLRICNSPTYCLPLQQWLFERTSVLPDMYIACVVSNTDMKPTVWIDSVFHYLFISFSDTLQMFFDKHESVQNLEIIWS